jgi:RNA polymerase sigma-70 factor, ECF subfamily
VPKLDDRLRPLVANSQLRTDEQLVRDHLRGDRAALSEFVERLGDRLARVAYRITGCSHEAEDVRNTVFVRFLQTIRTSADIDRIGPWLIRCAVNEAITRIRRRECEGRALAELAQNSLGKNGLSLQTFRETEVTPEQLSIALAQVTPDERALLTLRFDENLTFREIGELLERPASTIKSQMSIAIAHLRRLLCQQITD